MRDALSMESYMKYRRKKLTYFKRQNVYDEYWETYDEYKRRIITRWRMQNIEKQSVDPIKAKRELLANRCPHCHLVLPSSGICDCGFDKNNNK